MPTQTKKITLDTAALFLGKAIGLLLGMVRLNYVSTYLGVVNFGILNFALYFCSLFQVLFDFGISQLLTRDLARALSRTNEFVGKAILLKVAMVFVAGLVVGGIGLLSHFERATNWAILLTTVAFALNGLSLVFLAAFQAQRRMTIVSAYNIFNDLLVSVLVVLIIGRYPYIVTVLVLTIVVSALNLVIIFFVYVRSTGYPLLRIDFKDWSELLRASAPIAVSSIGISIYTFIGPTILKYVRGNSEVGLYSAGYKLISILTIIPLSFAQVVYPVFSEFYGSANAKLAKALQDSLRVMAQISFPLGVGVAILAPRVISMLYPATFSSASLVLTTIICGDALIYLGHILYAFLLAINHQRVCMYVSLASALFAIALNLLLVSSFGFMGAAYALVIIDIALFIAYTYFAHRYGYSVGSKIMYGKILLAAGVMAVVLFIGRSLYFVPVVIVAAAIYWSILYVTGGFGDQEREFIAKLLRAR